MFKENHCNGIKWIWSDAEAHSEHGPLIRCDIWPRSTEISPVD
jgi:hypothetical protein